MRFFQAPFEEPFYLSSALSLAAVLLSTLAGLAVIVWYVVRAFRAFDTAARWRQLFASPTTATRLERPGLVVLHGYTRTLDRDGPPVTVRVEQQGRQVSSKNGAYLRWREVSRTTLARPFAIELDDGRRVRVEPNADALEVNDEFDCILPGAGPFARVRATELSEGEELWAHGVLRYGHAPDAQGSQLVNYRTTPRSLVLREGLNTALLLSTESPERRARRDGRMQLVTLALLVATYLLGAALLSPFVRMLAFGEPCDSRLMSAQHVAERRTHKGRVYFVDVCRGTIETSSRRTGERRGTVGLNLDPAECFGPHTGESIGTLRVRVDGVTGVATARPGAYGALALSEVPLLFVFLMLPAGLHAVREPLRRRALGLRLDESEPL